MILITGCESYLGGKLANRLLYDGYKVKCLDEMRPKNISSQFEFIQASLSEYGKLKNACHGVDTIFHFMDIKSSKKLSRKKMKQMNVKYVNNLLDIAEKAGVRRLIFLSSYEVYGRSKQIPTRFDDKKKPITAYGKDKFKAEKLCMEKLKKGKMEIIIFRPALICGPEVRNPKILITLFMALGMDDANRFFIAGDGHTRFQMLHPDDALNAFVKAIDTPDINGKVYNLGSDYVMTQKEQVEKIVYDLNVYCEIKYISPLKARLLSILLRPFKINYLTKDHLLFLLNNVLLDCQKAKDELKWEPQKNNIQIIKETIEWYRTEKL